MITLEDVKELLKTEEKDENQLKFIEENGFDYCECWNLDYSIARYALPRLIYLRDHQDGYFLNSLEEWQGILNQIIESFYLYLSKQMYEMTAEERLKVLTGRSLFCKYFECLWD